MNLLIFKRYPVPERALDQTRLGGIFRGKVKRLCDYRRFIPGVVTAIVDKFIKKRRDKRIPRAQGLHNVVEPVGLLVVKTFAVIAYRALSPARSDTYFRT